MRRRFTSRRLRRIAEANQSTHALDLANDRFRSLITATADIVWTNSAAGEMTGEQAQWSAFTGQSLADYQGYGWSHAVHPDDRQPTVDTWQRAVAARGIFKFEHRVRRHDGVYRWFSIRGVPVLEPDGSIREWVGLHRDITDDKTSAVELESARAKLASLIQQIPVPINVLEGPELRITTANEKFIQITQGRDFLGKPLEEAFPEGRGSKLFEHIRAVYETGIGYDAPEYTFYVHLPDGSLHEGVYQTAYRPLIDSVGHVIGVVAASLELTDQIRIRGQLERAHAEAEDARIRAESANRAKDEFLAMLGHELRNPLAPILTALELMRMREANTFVRERAIIERQARHMARLVDDLLDISRITRGTVELKRQPVEVADLILKALEAATPILEQRKHKLVTKVPSQDLIVDADQARLVQVLSNLVTNAVKYTDVGGQITIEANRDDHEIVVRVSDTGRGISEAMLPRVFDLFSQERQNIDRSEGGLGLGLSIVKNLVELHGGSVSAQSEGAGRGSTFTVRLPASNVRPLVEPHAPRPTPMPNASPEARRAMVLLVDDNHDAVEVLAETLELLGYATCVAHDGAEALALAQKLAVPAVALLDIGLPGMDGYELAQRLRALPGWKNVPLIAVTGYGQESDRQQSIQAGFNYHLIKPIDVSGLERVLEEVTAKDATVEVAGGPLDSIPGVGSFTLN